MRPRFSDFGKFAKLIRIIGNFFGADFQEHFQDFGRKYRKHATRVFFSVTFSVFRCKFSATEEPAPKKTGSAPEIRKSWVRQDSGHMKVSTLGPRREVCRPLRPAWPGGGPGVRGGGRSCSPTAAACCGATSVSAPSSLGRLREGVRKYVGGNM